MMGITILLPIPPSVNNLFAGKSRRYRSKEYAAWLDAAGWEMLTQRPPKFDGKVAITIEVREPPTRAAEDCCNREKAVIDLLVAHRIIKDDSQHYLRQVTIRWAYDIAGVRVTIEAWGEA